MLLVGWDVCELRVNDRRVETDTPLNALVHINQAVLKSTQSLVLSGNHSLPRLITGLAQSMARIMDRI